MFELGADADNVYHSILPEFDSQVPSDRSSAYVSLSGPKVMLNIRANDAVSFRASLNNWLRLIMIAHEALINAKDVS